MDEPHTQSSQRQQPPPQQGKKYDKPKGFSPPGGVKELLRGMLDAVWVPHVVTVLQSKRIQFAVMDILFFNGFICFFTLWLFQTYFQPFIFSLFDFENPKYVYLLSYFFVGAFYALWAVPMFLLSFVINGKWLRIVTENSFKMLQGRPPKMSEQGLTQMPRTMAQEVYTSSFYALFLVQCSLCYAIPVLGPIANFIFLCWMYSMYCFEYRWAHLHIGRRLKMVEDNWAYFVGFGMVVGTPFTLVSLKGGLLIGYAVWWLLFPFFIIMAIGSKKLPYSSGRNNLDQNSMAIFKVTRWLNSFFLNLIVLVLRFVTGARK